MLPDRSVLIGQKLVENAKIQKIKCDILSNFQTMWRGVSCVGCNLGSNMMMQTGSKAALEKLCQGLGPFFCYIKRNKERRKLPLGTNYKM